MQIARPDEFEPLILLENLSVTNPVGLLGSTAGF